MKWKEIYFMSSFQAMVFNSKQPAGLPKETEGTVGLLKCAVVLHFQPFW